MKKFLKLELLGVAVIAIFFVAIIPAVRNFFVREIKSFGYSIDTVQDDLTSEVYGGWINKKPSTVLSVPVYYQKYSLSCEVASLRMALAYQGVYISEDDLIANLPIASLNPPTRDPMTGKIIWADPNVGFVGLINGKMPSTGYGVYEKPIDELALKYRNAKILEPASFANLISEIVAFHPVIVWDSITSGRDISWQDAAGNTIKAVEGEHARVAIGFRGTADSPTDIFLIDPVYGKIQMTTPDFLKNWALLGNKAVAIK